MKVFQLIKDEAAMMKRSRMMVTFGDDEKLRELVADAMADYSHVANVDAGSNQEVFEIMNRWSEEDEARVERIGDRQSSLSVGDIVADDEGEMFIVASFGFINLFANREHDSKVA